MITDYQWIDDNSECEALILSIKKTDAIAFDSEFERINTYYPKPALFQLCVNNDFYLIDMKKNIANELFVQLLDNIILHSGSEDLEILYNMNQQLPSRIFDTQIAASLCGCGLHYSYQNIVKEFFNIELSKAHSRSDWMQRPLSKAQIQYALEDVLYLTELKNILQEKLNSMDRMPWYELLVNQKKATIRHSNHVNNTFVKIAKSKKLKIEQQKLLYLLLQWREKMAIKRDKPRPWILKNHEIVDIVLKKPTTETELIKSIGLYDKFVHYNAKKIFGLYEQSSEIDDNSLPKYDKLTAKQGELYNKYKQQLTNTCEQLSIPQALVINVSDLKSLVASGKTLDDIELWRLINQLD